MCLSDYTSVDVFTMRQWKDQTDSRAFLVGCTTKPFSETHDWLSWRWQLVNVLWNGSTIPLLVSFPSQIIKKEKTYLECRNLSANCMRRPWLMVRIKLLSKPWKREAQRKWEEYQRIFNVEMWKLTNSITWSLQQTEKGNFDSIPTQPCKQALCARFRETEAELLVKVCYRYFVHKKNLNISSHHLWLTATLCQVSGLSDSMADWVLMVYLWTLLLVWFPSCEMKIKTPVISFFW